MTITFFFLNFVTYWLIPRQEVSTWHGVRSPMKLLFDKAGNNQSEVHVTRKKNDIEKEENVTFTVNLHRA